MTTLAGLLRNIGKIHSSSNRLSFFWNVSTGFEMHPTALSIGAGGLSLDFKIPRHKANHAALSGSEGLNEWSYTASFPYSFMTCTETPLPIDRGSMLVWNISNILPVSSVWYTRRLESSSTVLCEPQIMQKVVIQHTDKCNCKVVWSGAVI
jgi:hypothetical protein